MKSNRKVMLTTDLQLKHCMDSQMLVEVWVEEVFDCNTLILDFSSGRIEVEDGFYLRNHCELYAKDYFRTA